METTRSPRFLDDPIRICPALRPRPSRHIRPLRYADAAPVITTTKALEIPLSRLNHTAFAVTVYASRLRSPAAMQDSLLAAGQLCQVGLVPTGSRLKVSVHQFITSSFTRLSWREVIQVPVRSVFGGPWTVGALSCVRSVLLWCLAGALSAIGSRIAYVVSRSASCPCARPVRAPAW